MTAVQRYLQVSVTASLPPSLTVEYDWAYERWLASQVHYRHRVQYWNMVEVQSGEYSTVPQMYQFRAGAASLQILT